MATEALFDDHGARNVQETLRYSGVTVVAFGLDTWGDGSTVRGLNPVEYHDGMRRIYNFGPSPRVDVYTLSRVEVLRGPASVLYGQGSNGGIINLVSKRPEFTAGLRGCSSVRHLRMQAGAIRPDRPAGQRLRRRVLGFVRDADTQTDHVLDGRILLSPSLTWQPDGRTSLMLIGVYQRERTASTQQFLPVVATLLASNDRRSNRCLDGKTRRCSPSYCRGRCISAIMAACRSKSFGRCSILQRLSYLAAGCISVARETDDQPTPALPRLLKAAEPWQSQHEPGESEPLAGLL